MHVIAGPEQPYGPRSIRTPAVARRWKHHPMKPRPLVIASRAALPPPTPMAACPNPASLSRVTFDRKAEAVWCVRFQGAGVPSKGVPPARAEPRARGRSYQGTPATREACAPGRGRPIRGHPTGSHTYPKFCVHHARRVSASRNTPTPIARICGYKMFTRCPGLFIQALTTAMAFGSRTAMFSAAGYR